jgi:uncharacterized membrane protein HdeD (DUF308 family)
METKVNKNWWFLAINGIFAILIGLMFLLLTQEVIQSIMFFTGLAIAALGLIFLIIAVSNIKKDKSVGSTILLSICCLAIGIGIMVFKDKTLNLFFILLGIWAVITGIFQLIVLVNVKRTLANRNIILFNGLLTIALGVVMFFNPVAIGEFLVRLIGAFAIVFGIVMIYLSFGIRKSTAQEIKEEEKPAGNLS